MCIFLLPSCCSPKTNGLSVFLILRRYWVGPGNVHFPPQESCLFYLFSNVLDIIDKSLKIFKSLLFYNVLFSHFNFICAFSLFLTSIARGFTIKFVFSKKQLLILSSIVLLCITFSSFNFYPLLTLPAHFVF